MRACLRCGYDSADHLAYCVQCGRRLASSAPPRVDAAAATASTMAPGFAATLAVAAVNAAPTAASHPSERMTSPLGHAVEAIRYVFVVLRGRMDAGARRRRLAEEREGAVRLASGALVELGQCVLAEGINSPELNGLLEAVGAAQAQRETAVAEMTATETFRAAEDARLGQVEAAARSELNACEEGIAEVEGALRQIDDERLQLQAVALHPTAVPGATEAGAADLEPRSSLEARRARVAREADGLRERAAALRAAGMAAHAKVDSAVAARRQASSALNANIAGHARQRAEAEGRILALTTQIGRVAWQGRLADPRLLPRYERVDRHYRTLEDRDRQVATVERMASRLDGRRLAIGLGLLVGLAAATALALWALAR